jgi:hypothetical protein
MMKSSRCTVRNEDLLLLHYRELPMAEQASLEAHLVDCADCRRRQQEMVRTLQVFPPAQELSWSSADQRRLTARVAERLERHRSPHGLYWGTAAALLLLVALAVPWRAEMTHSPSSAPAGLTIMAELEMLDSMEFWEAFELLEELDLLQELEPLG